MTETNAYSCRLRPRANIFGTIILSITLTLCAGGLARAAADLATSEVQRMELAAAAPLETTRSRVNGLLTFLSVSGAPIPLPVSATAPAEARARAFVSSYGRAFGIADVADLAHAKTSGPDEVGMEHVRFRQLHGGVP